VGQFFRAPLSSPYREAFIDLGQPWMHVLDDEFFLPTSGRAVIAGTSTLIGQGAAAATGAGTAAGNGAPQPVTAAVGAAPTAIAGAGALTPAASSLGSAPSTMSGGSALSSFGQANAVGAGTSAGVGVEISQVQATARGQAAVSGLGTPAAVAASLSATSTAIAVAAAVATQAQAIAGAAGQAAGGGVLSPTVSARGESAGNAPGVAAVSVHGNATLDGNLPSGGSPADAPSCCWPAMAYPTPPAQKVDWTPQPHPSVVRTTYVAPEHSDAATRNAFRIYRS